MNKHRALWALTGLLALLFVITGSSKLLAVSPSPENFARWGLSPMVMKTVGVAEIAGAIGLLIPPLTPLAAIGLFLLMGGALRTGVTFHEPLHIFLPAALMVLLALVAFGRLRAKS